MQNLEPILIFITVAEMGSFTHALHVNSVQTYEAAGVAGLGLIQAPLLAIGRYLESGALIELLQIFSTSRSTSPW
jgi:DNA-binding transcriptional LysR family regulator